MKIIILFLLIIIKIVYSSNSINSDCIEHVNYYKEELEKCSEWAKYIYDSTTKLPDGLLYGNINQLGNFDECINAKSELFYGKYCSIKITFLQNYLITNETLTWALCMPATCQAKDIKNIIKLLLPEDVKINASSVIADDKYCYTKYNTELDTLAIVGIFLISLLCFIVIIATIIQKYFYKKQFKYIVEIFSAKNSIDKLLKIENYSTSIHCIHGLRVGSVLWIILIHRKIVLLEVGAVSNGVYFVEDWITGVQSQTFIGGFIAVDTFFFISGLLVTYLFLHSPKFKPIEYYINRYIRITGPMLFVILIYVSVLPYLANGPLWYQNATERGNNCIEQWWLNVLYINNFINVETMCGPHTWYLAVDMQLYWLCPLILLPLKKWGRPTLIILTLLILISCFIPFTITYIFKFPWTVDLVGKVPNVKFADYHNFIYAAVFSRATPYLVGIFLGYVLYKNKNKPALSLSTLTVILGWTACTFISTSVIYTLSIFYQPNYTYNELDAAFYSGFHKLGWSICLSWIVFACVNGYGGIINSILSWKYLQPFAKLSYSAYLSQFILFYSESGSLRNSQYFSDYYLVHGFLGDVPIIFTMAFIFYLLIESPSLSSVLKLLFKKEKTSIKEDKCEATNIIS